MLRTLPQTRDYSQLHRLAAAAVFTLLTIIAARVTIETGGPVPFTLQPLAVLLAGLVLGSRDGALSQLAYIGLIATGLPLDARMLGPAALVGPTAGFLIGFVAAAFVAGYLMEHGANRVWQRWLAGVVAILVLYALGVLWLSVYAGMDLGAAWAAGAAPFLPFDLGKALIAAAGAEGARALLLRNRL